MGIVSPTQKQINYAKSLGIDIPQGISRSNLSELINYASRSRKSRILGVDRHPNEVSQAAVDGMHVLSNERIMAASAYLRQKRIHVGTVLRRVYEDGQYGKPSAVTAIDSDEIKAHAVDATHHMGSWKIVNLLDGKWTPVECEVLFNPPERFLHWYWFMRQARQTIRKRVGNYCGYETFLRKHLPEALLSRLAPEHIVETAYGQFWQKDAAEKIMQELCTEFCIEHHC